MEPLLLAVDVVPDTTGDTVSIASVEEEVVHIDRTHVLAIAYHVVMIDGLMGVGGDRGGLEVEPPVALAHTERHGVEVLPVLALGVHVQALIRKVTVGGHIDALVLEDRSGEHRERHLGLRTSEHHPLVAGESPVRILLTVNGVSCLHVARFCKTAGIYTFPNRVPCHLDKAAGGDRHHRGNTGPTPDLQRSLRRS